MNSYKKEDLPNILLDGKEAMDKNDYLKAEISYHEAYLLANTLFKEAKNHSDREEYQSLSNECRNKESYARSMNEKDKESLSNKSLIHLDEFVGLENTKERLKSTVLKYYKECKLKEYDKNALFIYGPSGTGKTMLVNAIANEVNARIYKIEPLLHFDSKNYPDSENAVIKIFDDAKKEEKAIIFIETPLCYFMKSNGSKEIEEVTNLFLNLFRREIKKAKKHNILVIATSSCPDKLEPEIFKKGMFDDIIRIDLPDDETRKLLILQVINKIDETTLNHVVNLTAGYTSWEVTHIALQALIKEKGINSKSFDEIIYSTPREFDQEYFKELESFEKELNKMSSAD